MLNMNNIRFSYEEKNQNFGGQEIEHKEKTGIGKLLSKYERSKPADDDEESLVAKKKVVYHGNSLNYSQIYSDIRINRNDKILPATEKKDVTHYEHSGHNTRADNNQINPNLTYIPKSLPKIARNSRLMNRTEQHQRWDKDPNLSQNVTEQDRSKPRGKAFSISHYDIYKPNQERSSAFAISKHESRNSNDMKSEKNNSFVSSAFNQEVDQQSALKVKFEEAEKDLPEQNESHIEVMQNTISRKEFKIEPEKSDISLKHLEKEQIKIENKLPGLPRKPSYRDKQKQMHTKMEQKLKEQKSIREESITIQEKKPKDVTELQPLVQQPAKSRVKFIESRKSSAKSTLRPKQQTQQIKVPKQQVEQVKVVPANNYVEKQQKTEAQVAPTVQFKRKPSQSLTQPVSVAQMKRQPSQSVSRVSRASSQIKPEFVKRETSVKQQPKSKQESRKKIEIEVSNAQVKVKQVDRQEEKQQAKEKVEQKQEEGIKSVKVVEQSMVQLRKFDTEDYIKVYEILKVIETALRAPQIDTHSLVKQIKKYLQIVAGGGLDHVEGYDMPLHRLKIIKNALLYERIALVIISFSYAIGKMKQSLKYLINLITYSTNNTLLILKLLESCEVNKEVNKNPIMAKSDRLVLKRNFDTVRNNSDIILDSIFKISKNDEAFYESFKDILKSIGKNSLEQTFYNVLEYFAFFLCVSDLHMAIPFLAVAPNPYLRETIDKRPTLVIDIVEIFCHGTRKSKSHVFRPHTQHFLNEMSQYYEIVSFTCAYPNQIDKVIDILDPKKHIKHRLYRHHALMLNSAFYKDTERIGRNLNRLILLDSDINVIAGEINNTIMIPSWRGNKNDTTLAELCPILAAISIKHLDCREATRRIHEQQQKNESAGIKYLNFGINLQ